MDEPLPQHRRVSVHIAPEHSGGVWANFAAISHSPYEFTLDFVRLDFASETQEEINGVVVARVNLSPQLVAQLIDSLKENWAAYAEKSMPPEVRGE